MQKIFNKLTRTEIGLHSTEEKDGRREMLQEGAGQVRKKIKQIWFTVYSETIFS